MADLPSIIHKATGAAGQRRGDLGFIPPIAKRELARSWGTRPNATLWKYRTFLAEMREDYWHGSRVGDSAANRSPPSLYNHGERREVMPRMVDQKSGICINLRLRRLIGPRSAPTERLSRPRRILNSYSETCTISLRNLFSIRAL